MVTIDEVVVPPPSEGEALDPMSWYDSPGPFELEIGCGKGGFLLDRARSHPHVRLLGVEWANKYYRFCADRMARWNIRNVRVMRTDASELVIRHLPQRCVSVLHLYHPDPWPKKRHHKRRLIRPEFVDAVIRVLVAGGRWRIQSDHEEYFLLIRSLLDRQEALQPVPWDEELGAASAGWSGTNFEVKYAREGRTILRAAYAVR